MVKGEAGPIGMAWGAQGEHGETAGGAGPVVDTGIGGTGVWRGPDMSLPSSPRTVQGAEAAVPRSGTVHVSILHEPDVTVTAPGSQACSPGLLCTGIFVPG